MCGIAAIAGSGPKQARINAMLGAQRHRGPDATGAYVDPDGFAALGHNRLSIIDLTDAGRQPMRSATGRFWIVFNGEIYNYLELRNRLRGPFYTRTDTEVLLRAYEEWGAGCLDHLIGMFAFAVWDEKEKVMFAARDRFGVKPLYYKHNINEIVIASEIKALHAGGIDRRPDAIAWSTYLTCGVYDHSERTFWQEIRSLPSGHSLTWKQGKLLVSRWYDLASRTGDGIDDRGAGEVGEEYLALLKESIDLRFRSDVPVGINLSGGLDSSTLLAIVQAVQGHDSDVKAFTFVTGNPEYDELPWVDEMLEKTRHPSIVCALHPDDVPRLAESVQYHQDEPFGGIPTLAYARLFEAARENNVIVLLDGQGLDEQWCGYDYYADHSNSEPPRVIQGAKDSPVRPECLLQEFRKLAEPANLPQSFSERVRNLQYRDIAITKIPRALRFNDRASMRASTELREPFLDHRLVELALRQPLERKISNGVGKKFLREITAQLLPSHVNLSPKRALQTPQREWLRGPLRDWAQHCIDSAVSSKDDWLDKQAVKAAAELFFKDQVDNSFFIWQWISIHLLEQSTYSNV